MSRKPLESKLASNPRIVGALFTAGLLLVQAGSVVANGAGGNSGP